MSGVNITLGNGNIATAVATQDGYAGIVLTGASEGTVTAGTPFLINSMTDVTAAGLTTTNNAFAITKLQNLYNELLNFGITSAPVWVLLITSATKINTICDKTNANGAIKLLIAAGGKVRLLAVCTNDTAVYPGGTGLTTVGGINDDVYTAITNAQALAQQFFTQQQPLRVILGGTSFTGTASALTSQTTAANNRVAVLIGDVASGNGAAIGILLGRLIAIPVQRKVSRVKDGAISSTTAFIGTTSADQYTSTSTITGKGFISFQSISGKSGFFFTGDPTCTNPSTDDYHTISNGRVIDKAQILVYGDYVNEVDDEVPVNADGTIDAGWAKAQEQSGVNVLKLNMQANGNISPDVDPQVYIDPSQNVLSTNQVNVIIKLTPNGYASTISITLGL